ncbi:TRAFAC clade GTPase domain-containing protein [Sphaerisporangium aureirubrum]|uniref:Double-GTPase 2 domain-containing protein n=1 Tax=Sphaerisporangium aureirubrum TaxID=1544736 RepID=A0ABW1NR35_9ACTN
MPLVVVVLVVFWGACMFFGFLYGFPVVGVVTVVATTLAGVGYYFARSALMLGPGRDEGESGVAPAESATGRDPVYRHYLFRQLALDAWRVPRAVLPEAGRAGWRAIVRVTRWLEGGVQGFFLLPIWLGVVAGVVVAAVPLGVAAVAVGAAHLVVFAVGGAAWLVAVVLLRGTESVVMLVRRILQTCPHPRCYAGIALPEYACPTCGERHRSLRPNLDGALRHVCRCGTRLPTAIVLGRFRLRAYCPQCHRALPHRIGRARIEPLPFVGGPDAGKTTFMILAINALHAAVKAAGGRAGFVVEGDQQAFTRLGEELRLGRVSKTTSAAPSATMVDITLPRTTAQGGDRILYLFDPSGEGFTGATKVEAMSYLAHGEAMLIVVDPFALPLVQHGLTADERRVLEKAGVVLSPEDPSDTFQRVRNELAARADGGRQKRVAVVVSKADLLRKTAIGQDADRLPEWFDGVGLGNMVRDLARSAAEVRYLASGFPPDFPGIATMLAWLTRLPLNGDASALTAVGADELALTDLRGPWTPSTRRTGLVPLSHLLFRWSLLATSAALTVAALAALTAWAVTLVRPLLPI